MRRSHQSKSGVTVDEIAAQVGLTLGRSGGGYHLSPCPSCGATQRGTGDRRGPVGVHDAGRQWHCYRCDAGGTADALAGGQKREGRPSIFEPTPYLSAEVIRDMWGSCGPLPAAALAARGIDPGAVELGDLARGAVRDAPWWWGRWPVTIPMWDGSGTPKGLHGRRLQGEGRKGHFPTGYSTAGLFMGNAEAISVMVHRETAPLGIAVEGATDWLRMSVAVRRYDWPVWGCEAGSWSHLRAGLATEWLVCIDDDPVGSPARATSDRYVRRALGALGSAYVFRGDICDAMGSGMRIDDIIRAAIWLAA